MAAPAPALMPEDELRAALAGPPAIIVLVGRAECGKTRLIQHTCPEAKPMHNGRFGVLSANNGKDAELCTFDFPADVGTVLVPSNISGSWWCAVVDAVVRARQMGGVVVKNQKGSFDNVNVAATHFVVECRELPATMPRERCVVVHME